MKLVKEKFRFVFCTLHALMRWAKKEKDTKSIKDRLQLFFFSLFLSFFLTSFCYKQSFLYESIFWSILFYTKTIYHGNEEDTIVTDTTIILATNCSICESINQTRKLSLPPKLN